jgi:hypothetical protein
VVVPQVLPSYFIFADKLVMAEFCCFVVIMIWVNLRVSLVTGTPAHDHVDMVLSRL